jgi:glycosyltransferase involved in cell wall biosynthesis
MSLSVVIPVHFEQDNVTKLVSSLRPFLSQEDELIFVYDRDQDPTVPVLQTIKRQTHFSLQILKNKMGAGFRGAVLQGLQVAQKEWVAVMMGDLSDPPEVLKHMQERAIAQAADLVVASRYQNGPTQKSIKGYLSYWVSQSLSCFWKFPTTDFTNNFRLYRQSKLKELSLSADGGMEMGAEILVDFYRRGFQIEEVTTTWHDRQNGQSQFRLLSWWSRYLKLYWQAILLGQKNRSQK